MTDVESLEQSRPEYISPAEIGEFISFSQCGRYAKHRMQDVQEGIHHSGGKFTEAFHALNLLLSAAGEEFEEDIFKEFTQCARDYDNFQTEDGKFESDQDDLLNHVQNAVQASSDWKGEPYVLYQPGLEGSIAEWQVRGIADLILIWSTEDGAEIRVIDVKRTSEEKSYHQVQAAVYIDLLLQALDQDQNIGSDAVTCSAGIITLESRYLPLTRENVPKFDIEPRRMDVHRLLRKNGPIDRAIKTPLKSVNHQINGKCAGCPYNESCITDAFEDGSIRLLGVSPRQQEIMEDNAVESLDDLASLSQTSSLKDWLPTEYTDVIFPNPTYKELKSTPGIGELFPHLAFQAVAILDSFQEDPSGPADRPRNWLPGSGGCRLPEDSPPEESPFEHEWMHGSMVRVYLNIQHDHLRDRLIQLSGRVSSTASRIDPVRFSVLSQLAENDGRSEQDLLGEFVQQLVDAVTQVAESIPISTDQRNPPIHFYTYTELELDKLFDSFDRYPGDELVGTFRSLLEGTERPDDFMTSPLMPEIQNHVILETPSPGLVHAYQELQPPADSYSKPRSREAWSYTPDNETESVHLREVFGRRMFNIGVECRREGADGVRVDPSSPDAVDGLNSRMRYSADIPLGYLWAAVDRIDDEWESKVDDSALAEFELKSYRFRDGEPDNPITREDVHALGKHLCDAMEHVERSLTYRDSSIQKSPYPMEDISVDTFEPPSLATAADRYLWLEHQARRDEEYELYRKFEEQRLLSGESMPVKITQVREISDNTLLADGRLMYDHYFDEHAEQVQRACRQKGSEGPTSGSWMVSNPVLPGMHRDEVTKPHEIERGVNATIRDLDLEDGKIQFTVKNYWHEGGAYGRSHAKWTRDEDKAKADTNVDYHYFAPREWVILDPQTDDITAARIESAIEHADTNEFHTLLENIRLGIDTSPKTDLFDHDSLRSYADWLDENLGEDSFPSEFQAKFIRNGNNRLVGLQGPPGTGKTSGAIVPGILARVYAAAQNEVSLNGLVTAPSNTAIDEVLEETASQAEAAEEDGPLSVEGIDLKLVRIADQPPEDALDNVEYLSYNNPEDTNDIIELTARLRNDTAGDIGSGEGQATVASFEQESSHVEGGPLTLVFATVGRTWRFLKEVAPGSRPEDEEIASESLWHLLAIDEASMMELPHALLAGSALREDGQVLISGDHRQLPPVQKREWSEVRRRDIRSTAAYLSLLDYLRLLRGEDVLQDQQMYQFDRRSASESVTVPLIRLDTTYRFGQSLADLLTETIYYQDNVEFQSGRQPETVPSRDGDPPDALGPVFESDSTAMLVTYEGEERFQQWNPIETAITQCILSQISRNTDTGVVTPHNAQRGRIKSVLQKYGEQDMGDLVQVETVNRFQGGEKDLMLVSATVSDPNYIEAESDFLLQENRINVSLTRHRDMLIVLVPQSILGYIPSDPELYDQARIWKHFSHALGEAPTKQGTATWSGLLGDFVSKCGMTKVLEDSSVEKESDTAIRIYSGL